MGRLLLIGKLACVGTAPYWEACSVGTAPYRGSLLVWGLLLTRKLARVETIPYQEACSCGDCSLLGSLLVWRLHFIGKLAHVGTVLTEKLARVETKLVVCESIKYGKEYSGIILQDYL